MTLSINPSAAPETISTNQKPTWDNYAKPILEPVVVEALSPVARVAYESKLLQKNIMWGVTKGLLLFTLFMLPVAFIFAWFVATTPRMAQ
jgi:hypothetical protein